MIIITYTQKLNNNNNNIRQFTYCFIFYLHVRFYSIRCFLPPWKCSGPLEPRTELRETREESSLKSIEPGEWNPYISAQLAITFRGLIFTNKKHTGTVENLLRVIVKMYSKNSFHSSDDTHRDEPKRNKYYATCSARGTTS